MARAGALLLALLGLASAGPAAKLMSGGKMSIKPAELQASLEEGCAASGSRVVCTVNAALPGRAKLLNEAFGVSLPEATALALGGGANGEEEGLEVLVAAAGETVVVEGRPGFRAAGESLSAAEAGLGALAKASDADGLLVELLAEEVAGKGGPLRSNLAQLAGAKSGKKIALIFLVRGAASAEAADAAVKQYLQAAGLASLAGTYNVKALAIGDAPSTTDAEALRECVAGACAAELGDAGAIAARLLAGSAAAEAAEKVVLPGFEEVQAMGDLAAAKASALLDKELHPWRIQCEKKAKVVKNFGEVAEGIKAKCLAAYTNIMAQLTASVDLPEDAALEAAYAVGKDRFETDIADGLRRLQAVQLMQLAGKAERELQKQLLVALRKEGNMPRDRQAALVRTVLYDFAAAAKPVVGAGGAELYDGTYTALEERLGQVAARFMESPKAQLVTQSRVEKNAKRQKAAKGERSIKPRLDIVSMLNFPGTGSIEGFGAYQAGALNFIMGFMDSNAGDEPLFVIQPKFHFDVSL
uniref:Uncharacterized protein n=1 Tax=Phaeomonas parva TaxID=124430 RepID=A0A7S1TRI3_9STRA|mmetsp:Transcript_14465/g.43451  ORF Transcript_14465/g.43451 Transcript_14465/m.43451 type:complete len:528 (+) Transcript_14465:136-1719(+)